MRRTSTFGRLFADETELGLMLNRLPLRDLVRHQVAIALAIERSLETEDPPSPHWAAAAAVVAQAERASGSADAGPFFAKQPVTSAEAKMLQAKAPPPDLDENVARSHKAEARIRSGGKARAC